MDSSEKVAKHYDTQIFDYEMIRLEKDSPVEYAITLRKLLQYVPNKSTVADIGVGCGHYAESLAKRDCLLHLVDVSKRLLRATKERLGSSQLSPQILTCTQASSIDLSHIENKSIDVVLLLGPLYHLQEIANRKKTIEEAKRILKKGGILFAAAINRLGYFRELWNPERFKLISTELQPGKNLNEFKEFFKTGNINFDLFPALDGAHLSTYNEFKALFDSFEELECLGVESFTAYQQKFYLEKAKEDLEAWLDLVEISGSSLEGITSAEHFLYIGRLI